MLKALSRTTDPLTSHAAAATVKVSKAEQAFLDALKALGRATAYEVGAHAASAGLYHNADTVRKRAGGLKAKKMIVVDGKGTSPAGNSCEAFRVA
jgi:hypothetical protein